MTKKNQLGSVRLILIAVIFFGLVCTLVFVVWQNYSQSKNDTNKNDTNITIDDSDNKAISMKTFLIPEIGSNLSYPSNYSLIKNDEENRAGSSVSYNFENNAENSNYTGMSLGEILIFTKQSISDFEIKCSQPSPMECFEGYHPNLVMYNSFLAAFTDSRDVTISDNLSYLLKNINDRKWLITDHDYSMRKAGGEREYITFFGDNMVSVRVTMSNVARSNISEVSDVLDSMFLDLSFK